MLGILSRDEASFDLLGDEAVVTGDLFGHTIAHEEGRAVASVGQEHLGARSGWRRRRCVPMPVLAESC